MVNTPRDQDARIVVVAAIIEDRGRVLVARRRADSQFAGLWEFPGGKVEAGETRVAALQREIREELGIQIAVRPEPPVETVAWDYEHARVLLVAFRSDIVSGTPQLLDHEALDWVPVAELADLPLLPADRPVAARLRALALAKSTSG
jgi:8-oxo-dGTP diphosphatase